MPEWGKASACSKYRLRRRSAGCNLNSVGDFESIDLDALLDEQGNPSAPRVLVTIEKLDDDDARVKVTPWSEGSGCLCDIAVRIPKDAFESVTRTESEHLCCGKRLAVVEPKFAEPHATWGKSSHSSRLPQNLADGHQSMGSGLTWRVFTIHIRCERIRSTGRDLRSQLGTPFRRDSPLTMREVRGAGRDIRSALRAAQTMLLITKVVSASAIQHG